MKILFVSLEVVPFAKVGGLGDVAGSLPKSIRKLDQDIRLILPKHRTVDDRRFTLNKEIEGMSVPVDTKNVNVDIYKSYLPKSDVPVYFVANDYYYDRPGIYDDNSKQYDDDLERYVVFARAVLSFIKQINWKPDVVHCNDWHTALIVMYLKTIYKDDPFYSRIAVIYSTHNMGYQGIFPLEQLPLTGFDEEHFPADNIELRGKVDLAKSAFIYADLISTVSEQFSKEIQAPEYGYGLDKVVKSRSNDVFGIVNGLDYELWDPATDEHIAKKYSKENIEDKAENKKELQKITRLPVDDNIPLIGIVSRLADQKGFDILAKAIPELMKMDLQIVILGMGEPKYHKKYAEFHEKYPKKLFLSLKFDVVLAQKIYAGSDMFLMPSKYEPCGLGQMISYKYGTIPIVRKTGGLADTVFDYVKMSNNGTGFIFEKYSSKDLVNAVKRAVDLFNKDKNSWKSLMLKVMDIDYSWDASANKYVELYNKAVAKVK